MISILKKENFIDKAAYWFVLFLVVFIPFEDFLLKFLPVSDKLYFYSRFLSEIFTYAIFIVVIVQKIVKSKPLFATPLDPPILVFLQIVLFSAIANQSDIFASLVNIRPVFRYIILFYLVTNIKITVSQAKKILQYSIGAGVVQLFVGLVQYASKGAMDGLLQPRGSELDIGGVSKDFVLLSGREIGSVYGAAGDTILYASFMIIFLVLILSKIYIINHKISEEKYRKYEEKITTKQKNIALATLIIATLFIVSLTYSRICIILSLLIVIAYTLLKFYQPKRIAVLLLVFSCSIPLMSVAMDFSSSSIQAEYGGNARREKQSVIEDTAGIFTKEYISIARQQRLGAVVDIPLTVMFNKPLLGYGPDQLKTIDDINNSKTSFLTRQWKKEAFNDVYWSATIAYYGFLGVFAMFWIFYRLQKWARIIYQKTQNKIIKELSLSVIAITFATMILLFFNQFIEFRIYSLYFWLFPGIIFNLYHQEKLSLISESNEAVEPKLLMDN